MARIQGDAGDSLARTYDVVGSRVDLAEFRDGEGILPVHDIGQVVTSERLWSITRYVEALAVPQSTNFNAVITDLPGGITRILLPRIITNVSGQIRNVNLSLISFDDREVPLIAWDTTGGVDREKRIRWHPSGGTLGDYFVATPEIGYQQTILTGSFQPPGGRTFSLALRGFTLAFGAGTMDIRAVLQIAFVRKPGGLDDGGYVIPSW